MQLFEAFSQITCHRVPHLNGRRKQSRGLTLIEVLMTMSVITILVSLVAGSVRDSWAQARQVKCASNLRQIGVSLFAYAGSSRSLLAPVSFYHLWGGDGTGEDSAGKGWTEFLFDSSPNSAPPEYLRCPSFPERGRITTFMSARWLFLTGRNSWKLDDIQLTSRFLLAADCTRRGSYPAQFGTASRVGDDCDKDDGVARSVLFDRARGGEFFHIKRNNVVFADGHAEGVTRDGEARITYHPRRLLGWQEMGSPGIDLQ